MFRLQIIPVMERSHHLLLDGKRSNPKQQITNKRQNKSKNGVVAIDNHQGARVIELWRQACVSPMLLMVLQCCWPDALKVNRRHGSIKTTWTESVTKANKAQ